MAGLVTLARLSRRRVIGRCATHSTPQRQVRCLQQRCLLLERLRLRHLATDALCNLTTQRPALHSARLFDYSTGARSHPTHARTPTRSCSTPLCRSLKAQGLRLTG